MKYSLQQLLSTEIDWVTSKESPYIHQATINQELIKLRINDFPDEPFCTVIIDGDETDLEELPPCWTLPRHRGSIS